MLICKIWQKVLDGGEMWLVVFWIVTLKMEAVCSSESFVTT
jgi:hypothetical protein